MELIVVQRDLGQRIRELRKKKNWSQHTLGNMCGLHRSHMGAIERGQSNITLASLLKIAENLDTSLSGLFKEIT
jgi:transcriptional regulator with XRE-family HTH domain